MEIVIDKNTLSEAGFNVYLNRELYSVEDSISLTFGSNQVDASNLVGGIIGSEGIIYLGSKQIKLDGKNRRITVGDEILIGYE
jgi:hypothetical protein